MTGSDNGLLPVRHQAIIWTNVGLLSVGPMGTDSSEILIKIKEFSFKKINLKMWSAKWQPCYSCLNVLWHWSRPPMSRFFRQFRSTSNNQWWHALRHVCLLLSWHFIEGISKCIFLNGNIEYWKYYYWSASLSVPLTTSQHSFRQWLGAEQVICILPSTETMFYDNMWCHYATMI